MKKTLIALAAVAFTGSAFAQDSVTLYGRIAYDYTYTKEATNQQKAESNDGKFNQRGSIKGSYIGIKGQESIADGTNAVFKVERGFDSTNGQEGTKRQTYFGVESDSFGSVYLGRKDSLSKNHVEAFDALDLGGNYIQSGIRNYGRLDKSITYFSPVFYGAQAGVQFAKADNDAYNAGVTIQYASDFGLDVGLTASSNFKSKTTDLADDKTETKFDGDALIQFGASYNFDIAKVYAQVGYDVKFENSETVSLDKPFTAELGVSANVTDEANVAAYVGYGYDREEIRFGLAGTYALSNRTSVFGGFGFATRKDANEEYENNYEVTVGVSHAF